MKTSGWELKSLPQGAKTLGEYVCVGLVSTHQGREGPQGSQADLPHFTPLQTEN